MSEQRKGSGMKSSYELALERLASQGIEPPREEALDSEARAAIADERRKAEAALAQLEIMHRAELAKSATAGADLEAVAKSEEEYRAERRRIEERRDRAIATRRGEPEEPTGPE